jgi:hypothetical protein
MPAARRASVERRHVDPDDQPLTSGVAATVSLMGGTTTDQDINACLDSEQKAPRSDHQGPGDVFLRRQSAAHANGFLSPKLRGMAHLPRDGTGCEKG